ncbi:hypothetical protein [Acinetobacter sp.]|uniref:hypothetical protein n=1 Tax=Acinetobacter sp. TaxID=472 RepID=UPI003CFEBC61
MNLLKHLGGLPRSLQVLASAFISSDPADPHILEMSLSELEHLAEEEEIVFQLIMDRKYKRWYLVGVGDYEREIASDYIYHNPMKIKRSVMAFSEVDDSWIRSQKAAAIKQKMISETPREFITDGAGERWI